MKTELLMPAGNLEKLKYSLMYGADAVYIGGKVLSLRAQASNFTIDDIKEGVEFAHSLNKKVYVTVNVIPRESEKDLIKDYLESLERIHVDGIIVSSPAILYMARTYTNIHISISTQASVTNLSAIKFYSSLGANRVVLARELSIDEIKYIKENTDTEIEVFIHGGMCSGFSGRCTLSNYMSKRDANGGGCAHSCRWSYDIYEDDKKINTETFKIGSKDLCAISYIKDMIDAGIDSLKVEGRMKSISYVSTIAYTYRTLIDDIYNNDIKDNEYYLDLMGEQVNRSASDGFLSGHISNEQTLYSKESSEATQAFYGIVLDYNKEKSQALLEVRNFFKVGEKVEILSPGKPIRVSTIEYIINSDGVMVNEATHALEKVTINSNIELNKHDIIRRLK